MNKLNETAECTQLINKLVSLIGDMENDHPANSIALISACLKACKLGIDTGRKAMSDPDRKYPDRLSLLSIAEACSLNVFRNSDVNLLDKGEYAVLLIPLHGGYTSGGNSGDIIYDDKLSRDSIRFSIAHELGHFFLNHCQRHLSQAPKCHPEQFELEADAFAIGLLSVEAKSSTESNAMSA